MLCMQAGCEADVATAAMASPDMEHGHVATAICCHSNSNNATSQNNRLGRFVRRMRKLGDMSMVLYLAMAYSLIEIKCPAWHKSTEPRTHAASVVLRFSLNQGVDWRG